MDPQYDLTKGWSGNDSLRKGFMPIGLGADKQHPVEKVQLKRLRNEETFKMKMYGATYGLHAPLRFCMERNILAQCGRHPGLPSSYIGLHTVMGTDDRLDFEDVLGVDNPVERPSGMRSDHDLIAERFGL